MSKDSPGKYYKDNKERLQEKLVKNKKKKKATIWSWMIQKSSRQ